MVAVAVALVTRHLQAGVMGGLVVEREHLILPPHRVVLVIPHQLAPLKVTTGAVIQLIAVFFVPLVVVEQAPLVPMEAQL
jgi:hypothetical protein